MIFSENRRPLFRIMLPSTIFSENRYPLFQIMLYDPNAAVPKAGSPITMGWNTRPSAR
jgi:hypothetical protein